MLMRLEFSYHAQLAFFITKFPANVSCAFYRDLDLG